MIGFEEVTRLYLLGLGVTEVTLRSGKYPIEDVPLAGILPYLAWQSQIGSKLLIGVEPLELDVNIDKKSFRVKFLAEPTVLNVSACLQGLAIALAGCEKGNLIPIEDEVTSVILGSDGRINIQKEVNDAFLAAYDSYLDDWRATKELRLDDKPTMEIR